MKQNHGEMSIGTSRESTEFTIDCLQNCWDKYGALDYPNPNPTEIMIFCDGGGGNSSRSWLFKYD